MIEAPMPQDILKYKTKFIAGFSMRQCAFIVVAAAVAILLIFKVLNGMSGIVKIYIAAVPSILILVAGFATPFGQNLEKIAKQIVVDNFIVKSKRYNEIVHPEYEKFRNDTFKPAFSEEERARLGRGFTALDGDEKPTLIRKRDKHGRPVVAAKSKEYKRIL